MASSRKDVPDCINEFTLAIYRQVIAENPDENIFLSPSNVAVVMTMVYIGAREQTKEQMAKVLKLTKLDRQHVLKQMKTFVEKLEEKNECVTLKAANSIFPHSEKRILETYVSTIKEYFRAAVIPMNYTSKPDQARLEINTWVEGNTNGKIKNLLRARAITPLTAMVIVNAIYFKGNWEIPFKSKDTETKDFIKLNGEKINVEMMRAKMMKHVRYNRNRALDCQVLQLSYEDRNVAMVIVLPNKNNGLPALECKLNLAKMRDLINDLGVATVDVSLPKFKLESSIGLKQVLAKLGMVDVFDSGRADLSEMGNGLYVSEAYHNAFIDVNEEGTEAGAATAAVVELKCLVKKTYMFNAKHPFLFMIWNYKLDVPLFIGRLLEPMAATETTI